MGMYQLINQQDNNNNIKKNTGMEGGDLMKTDSKNQKYVEMEEGLDTTDKELSVMSSSTPPIQILKNTVINNNDNNNNNNNNSGGGGALKSRRLVSLDVFRGLTVALMVLVDDAGGIFPAINHSPWNGVTLADFVMPFFLAILRALKLLIFGLVLQGGYLHGINNLTYGVDIQRIRWTGTLQRIAIAYLLTAICEIWLKGDDVVKSERSLLKKYQFQWIFVLVLTVTYTALMYGLYVPDWEYQSPSDNSSFSVKCGVRGDTGPACNAVGMIDRKLLGIQHLYKRPTYARTTECSINSPDYGPLPPNAPTWCQAPFDPEGILSSVMAIVTCMIGLHFGHIIVHFNDHKDRLMSWMVLAAGLVVVGFILDFCGMHVNKALYSLSYTCLTAGAGKPTLVFEWMGMHALMIYIFAACNVLPVLLQGFYWKKPENNILRLIGIGRS
ncbi:hypothetical protein MKW92_006467 [Papaver armeniacum]|nr:hypothetical protein MKW92_006467 [Papaver armeniacum]